MDARVLIVEDDAVLADRWRRALEHAGCETRRAGGPAEALRAYRAFQPDLVLLDLMLEDKRLSGFDVLAAIRSAHGDQAVHVVILSGQSAEAEQLRGLHLGADNYLVKPVTEAQLVARVQAHLRRRGAWRDGAEHGRSCFGELEIDLDACVLRRAAAHIQLTPVERQLLGRLLATPTVAVGREELLQVGWGLPGHTARREDLLIRKAFFRMRDKARALGCLTWPVEARNRQGYLIAAPEHVEGVGGE